MTGKDKKDEADQPAGDCASPPCFMHEVDPAYFGLDQRPEAEAGGGQAAAPQAESGEKPGGCADAAQPDRHGETVRRG